MGQKLVRATKKHSYEGEDESYILKQMGSCPYSTSRKKSPGSHCVDLKLLSVEGGCSYGDCFGSVAAKTVVPCCVSCVPSRVRKLSSEKTSIEKGEHGEGRPWILAWNQVP